MYLGYLEHQAHFKGTLDSNQPVQNAVVLSELKCTIQREYYIINGRTLDN